MNKYALFLIASTLSNHAYASRIDELNVYMPHIDMMLNEYKFNVPLTECLDHESYSYDGNSLTSCIWFPSLDRKNSKIYSSSPWGFFSAHFTNNRLHKYSMKSFNTNLSDFNSLKDVYADKYGTPHFHETGFKDNQYKELYIWYYQKPTMYNDKPVSISIGFNSKLGEENINATVSILADKLFNDSPKKITPKLIDLYRNEIFF